MILKKANWLMVFIDLRVDRHWWNEKKPTKKELELIEFNRKVYFFFVMFIEELLQKYHEPRFNKYKYIDSLPVSVYKSLHYLLSDVLFRSTQNELMYNKMKKEYQKEQGKKINKELSKKSIESKRNEIKNEIDNIIRKYKVDCTFDSLKTMVYFQEDTQDFYQIVEIFSNAVTSQDDLSEVIKIIQDLWNHFPHRCLNGKTPVEMY